MGGLLFQAFLYLCAAIIAVPIAKRLGLGSVLGYLIAGIMIGPVLGLVGAETQTIQHFAEFGVVMMLFLVGLELEPRMLWEMRNRLLGLGGLQVSITALVIMLCAWMLGLYWSVALAIGLIFSLSSTAIVLQTLNEKGLTKTEGGRGSFSVLLFQDIAVIPMLALIPLLLLPELASDASAVSAHADEGHHTGASLVAGLAAWQHALVVLAAIAFVLLGGHFLSRPLFRFLAESNLREIFTAGALLLVIGIALLMTLVELSPALGTFLAGVVLANSEFRHELESDIEPFKGLLLGLFFITVGAGIDFSILFNDFATILGLTVGVMSIKGIIIYSIAYAFNIRSNSGLLMTLGLAQAGEFGFVLLNFSVQNHVIPVELSKTLSLVVALSMLLTPILFILYDKIVLKISSDESQQADEIDEKGSVIIAGVGRFGQIVNRLLVACDINTIVLDHESSIVKRSRLAGIKSYFGDASRPDLLHAAGIESASAFVVAIDDPERAVEMVEHVHHNYPKVKILARAFDLRHLYRLRKAGADVVLREMFDSSLELGKQVLIELGEHPFKVTKKAHAFRQHDIDGIEKLYKHWQEEQDLAKNQAFLKTFVEHGELLKEKLEEDRVELHDRTERGWTPPPKS